MVVGAPSVEVDTFNTQSQSNAKDGVPKSPKESKTPKHCNTGRGNNNSHNIRSQGNTVPNFHPTLYAGYPPTAHSYRHPGLYNTNPANTGCYGAPSVMVSPGGGGYHPHSSFYPGGEYLDPSYGHYPSQRLQHPMYGGADMHNRGTIDPRSRVGYSSQATGLDFSRTVSSSFGENNSKSSSDKGRNNEKGSTDSLPNFRNYSYKDLDDRSMLSEKSDTSWKLLNQVASIEEEKFRSSEESRLDTTSPIGNHGGNPHIMKSRFNVANEALNSLSSVASMQEPIDTSNSKDELDLIQCASSGSLLFNTNEETFMKRGRENRCDTEENGRDSDEIRRGPSSSPPNVANLSMRDDVNDTRPQKKRREEINDYYDQPPSYTFSLESAPSFSKDQQFANLPSLQEKPRPPSMLAPFDIQKDKNNVNKDEMLASTHIPWDEIKNQDSFTGHFSMGSHISINEGGEDDGPLITSSFSFGRDGNDDYALHGKPIGYKNMSQHHGVTMEKTNKSQHKINFPPPSATWVTNVSNFNDNKAEANHHVSNLYASAPSHVAARSFSSSNLSMQRMMPNHHTEMMRAFSHDSVSGRSSSPSSSALHSHHHPHYGPLHGPYGAPLPPHMPQSDSHLPPPFRPPHPAMANHHPQMGRRPPQAVYMMSSPGGSSRQPVQRNTSMDSSASKPTAGIFGWSKQDDARLSEIMKKFKNPKDWEPVAQEFGGGKTAKECHDRWIRYLKPGVRKGQWQDHEDAIVVEAVTTSKEQPFTRWSDLAQRLPGRVGKQIRDRWVNHLNPNINHMPFSREDDMLLWEGHKKLGKRWVEISSKYFNASRSENHIKNRWYSASFKKFVSSEFGPDAYSGGKKKESKVKGKSMTTS